MNSDLPNALIIGIGHFAAKKLAEEIVSKDINVVGVGEYVDGLNEIKNFNYFANLEEVEGNFNYVFDFNGDLGAWNNLVEESEKITIICINNQLKSEQLQGQLKNNKLNWRLVEANGVYGPGMDDNEESKDTGFLVAAFKQAVLNKNLLLPPVEDRFRLLCVEDLVDAVLRASFLSGTEEEIYTLAGSEINSEILAGVLINEAKMTRYKVMQKKMELLEWDEKKILETQKKLRWQARIDFNDGVKETLQYFFVKIDEESRRKPEKKEVKKTVILPEVEEKRESPKKSFEVIVEEKIEEEPVKIIEEEEVKEVEKPIEKEIIKKEEKKEEHPTHIFKPLSFEEKKEEEAVLVEEMDDFSQFVVKNSNMRQARSEPVEESKPEEKKPEIIEEKRTEKKNRRPSLKIKINKKALIFAIVSVLIVVLAVPVGWGISTYKAWKSINEISVLTKNKKYTEAENLGNKHLIKLRTIDGKIDDWGLNQFAGMRHYQTVIKAEEEALGLESKLVELAQSGDEINDAIFKNKAIDWDKELNSVSGNLDDVSSKIGVLQARLSGDWEWLPMRWRSGLQKKIADLNQGKKYIELSSKAIKIAPDFLGLDGKKREYLVLLQNETEIRPGGGFIGSYGLLSFEKGKLLNFEIKDVYEADGQLNGHVEPPEEIKNYLGEANYYMRDANWNANFPDAAVDLQWFLDKETGKKVDGVIGINLGVARAVLGAVGEVFVPDFKERINKDNLYEQAEFYAETKFFPGSTQKASFLGGLGKQLFDNIQNLKADQKLSLVEALIDSLQKNNMQIALNNKNSANVLADLNWNGAIYQGKCGVEGCISDYLYVVEANLGVNKANYFLYRTMEETVDFSNQSLSRVLKINYENTAKNANWPGGDYKNYMRIYLPSNVNLSQVSLIDTNNPTSKKTYSDGELKIREINGKKEIGFLMTVPVSTKRTVEVRYSTGIDLSKMNKISYVNYFQKQSGFGDTGLVTLISYPPEWQAVQVQPTASLVGGKLLFNSKLDQDIKMGIELDK